METQFKVGDLVRKVGGDYTFEGVIVAAFTKLDATKVRYVVEDDRGVLHIYSDKVLAQRYGAMPNYIVTRQPVEQP